MKLFKLFLFISFILIPTHAFAWGPLTHVYLSSEILSLASLLPVGLYKLLSRYREDFIYGNVMADTILGKNYLPFNRRSHSWDVAFDLMDTTETPQQEAFVYGYISHLAADTVAHGKLTKGKKSMGHTFYELMSDSLVGRKYWFIAVAIKRHVQRRNDVFLEATLKSTLLSVKTSKRIYKGMVFLTGLTPKSMSDFVNGNIFLPDAPDVQKLKLLHTESLDRMLDILSKGKYSNVIEKDPIAKVESYNITRFFRNNKG